MDADRFRKLAELFERARVLRPAARDVFLRHACSDSKLREEVESLLSQHDTAESQAEETLLAAGESLRRDAEAPLAAEAPSLEETQVPTYIGRYRVKGEIARGGAGIVLRAVDEEIGRDVALKVLRNRGQHRNPALATRLLEEGRIVGKLEHPGLVPVYELGTFDGDEPYLVMKVVEGRTFGELLSGRSDLAAGRNRLLSTFARVCEAVAYAHASGVIHRDLKPQNLMVGAFGEVQVMDWGLAKVVEGDSRGGVALTRPGAVMGTPAYMAPEQALGSPDGLDARTDVFGLGAILCEVLTGEPPYVGESNGRILRMARHADTGDAIQRLRDCGAGEEVVELAISCLAGLRDDRPADASQVAKGLRRYLESLDQRTRTAEMHAASAQARVAGERRARKLTGRLLAGALLAIGLGGVLWTLASQDSVETAMAQQRSELLAERSRLADQQRTLAGVARKIAVADASGFDLGSWRAADSSARAAALQLKGTLDTDGELRLKGALDQAAEGLQQAELQDNLKDHLDLCRGLDGWGRTPTPQQFATELEDFCGGDPLAMDAEALSSALGAAKDLETVIRTLDRWVVSAIQHRASSKVVGLLRAVVARLDTDAIRTQVRDARRTGDRATLNTIAAGPLDTISAGAAITLAEAMAVEERPDKVAEILDATLGRYPDDVDLLHVASIVLRSTFPERAVASGAAVRALRSDRPWSSADLIAALSAAGRVQEAVSLGESLRNREGSKLIAACALGEAQLKAGQASQAASVLRTAVRGTAPGQALHPVATALYGSALLQGFRGQQPSRTALGEAFKQFHSGLAGAASMRSDPLWILPESVTKDSLLRGLEELGRRTDSDPDLVELLRGRVLLAKGYVADAEQVFRRLERKLPKRLDASYWVRWCQQLRND